MLELARKTEAKKSPETSLNFSYKQENTIKPLLYTHGSLQISRKMTCPCDGGCPRCASIQAKLRIGEPDDEYEKEADRVAEQVMRMPDPVLQPKRNCPLDKGASCKEDEEDELKNKTLMKKEAQAQAPVQNTDIPPIVHDVLQSPGQPLDSDTRKFFEPRFGYDFSDVSVHTDTKAEESARAVNARAYTVGKDVVFGRKEYSPEVYIGQKLLAHELMHVVQQNSAFSAATINQAKYPIINTVPIDVVQLDRDAGVSDSSKGMPDAGVINQPKGTMSEVSLVGNDSIQFAGLVFQPDATKLRILLEKYVIDHGITSTRSLIDSLHSNVPVLPGGLPEHEPEASLYLRLNTILPILQQELAEIETIHSTFITDFENLGKANLSATLTTSEDTAKKEAVRYGLTEEQIRIKTGSRYGEEWERSETKYHMQTSTPIATGLQRAAEVLLARRKNIEKLEKEQRSATRFEHNPDDEKGMILVPDEPRFSELGREVQLECDKYMQIRSSVIAEYPVLAAVSELGKSIDELETIAKEGAGEKTAEILGAQITERLANIAKVRDNLDNKSNVNIWLLPPIVDATSAQLGANSDALKKRFVADKVEKEEPGLLRDIALLIFNFLAIALAPATGGISLAVAAGVNVVATGFEVQEYMMKKALFKTDFDKARALSQEDPSLFWLAISIVGTVFDVQGATNAIKAFRNLAPLAKAAGNIKSATEAEEAIEVLTLAAQREGGEQLAKRVVANVSKTRAGESLAMEAAGATKTEREALEAAATASKLELRKSFVKSVSGDVTLTEAGYIFSCSSPCTILREKYAKVLSQNKELEGSLSKLEKSAKEAAKKGDVAASKILAEQASSLNQELRKLQIKSTLEALGPKYKILKNIGLDAAAIERVLAKAGDLGQMKGQLLEELLASRVRSMLESETGRAALTGKGTAVKLEFIEGHRIMDKAGRQLTDGIIVINEGGKYHVVTIFESKAGRASSRGLKYSYKSVKDLSEEELKILRMEAIDELRGQNKAMARLTSTEIESKFPKEVEKMMNELPKGEAGQVRKDIERLVPNSGQKSTTILVDRNPIEVTAGTKSTKTIGVIPSDINSTKISAGFQSEGLQFEAMNLDIKQEELKNLAIDLAHTLMEVP